MQTDQATKSQSKSIHYKHCITAASWNLARAGFSLRKIFYKHQASIYQKVTLQAQDTGYQVQNTRYEREWPNQPSPLPRFHNGLKILYISGINMKSKIFCFTQIFQVLDTRHTRYEWGPSSLPRFHDGSHCVTSVHHAQGSEWRPSAKNWG